MRATAIALLVLALGCGSVRDRDGCSASPDCAAGTYCARTADGNVCWPDGVPPAVTAVTVTCNGTPCLRDGTLTVTADVADDAEVLSAEVTLDLASSTAVPMVRSGTGWRADIPLAPLPFEHFEHGVQVKVTARDGARNAASVDASGVTTVTRLRFQRYLDPALTPPAVMEDGTVVVAGANHKALFVTWDGGDVSSVQVGTVPISAAPLVLGDSVWIGSEDNWVYELTSLARVPASPRADTGGAIRGALAATSSGTVIATSGAGTVYAVTAANSRNSQPGAAFSLSAVLGEDDSIYAVGGFSARRLTLVGGIPTDSWSPPVSLGATVTDPIACTTTLLAIANPGTAGYLKRVSPAGDPQHVTTTEAPSGGIAILSDQSILVPQAGGTITRWTDAGAPFPGWSSPVLGGAPRTPLVLSGPASFVVSTGNGRVFSIKADGTIGWSAKLSPGTAALQPGNFYTPPPPQQTQGATMSTAYFAGADGYLHGVIVDGQLDASAPWPKAFHDPKNTNRAGPQP